jgi:hypothetical protein
VNLRFKKKVTSVQTCNSTVLFVDSTFVTSLLQHGEKTCCTDAIKWSNCKKISVILDTFIFSIHTYHSHVISKRVSKHLRYSYEIPTFYQNDLAVKNTADWIGGKPVAVWSQLISSVRAINPLVAFYDIHERYSSEIPTFYHNYSAKSNTANVTDGKPIAV